MAFKLPSLIEETFTTTGTGPITLGGNALRRKTFASGLSNADTCFYVGEGGTDYEAGFGTYSGGVLTRTKVRKSSNGDALVDWPAGTKTIRITPLGPSDLDADMLGLYTDLLLGEGTTLLPLARLAGVILSGCTLSNNGTDATNDIDIAAGYVVSDDGAAVMTVPARTKRLDAAWAVGTNQGGLDTGSIANTTYHLWVIQRSDTGVVDVLFSASASAPTMPTNYDRKAYLGAVLRESAALVGFVQHERTFMRSAPVQDFSSQNPGTSAVTRTLSVPAGVQVEAILSIEALTSTNNSVIALLTDLALADTAPSTSAFSVTARANNTNARDSATVRVVTNTSRQIRSRLSFSDTNTFLVNATHGWTNLAIKRLAA